MLYCYSIETYIMSSIRRKGDNKSDDSKLDIHGAFIGRPEDVASSAALAAC